MKLVYERINEGVCASNLLNQWIFLSSTSGEVGKILVVALNFVEWVAFKD